MMTTTFGLAMAIEKRQHERAEELRQQREREAAREKQEREERASGFRAFLADFFPPEVLSSLDLRIEVEGNVASAHFDYEGVRFVMQQHFNPHTLAIRAAGTGHRPQPGTIARENAARNFLDYIGDMTELRRQYKQDQAQQAARVKAARIVDAECRKRVAQAVVLDKAKQWCWPEGRARVVYRWRWATAPVGDEGYAEYDSAWSERDELVNGWLFRINGNPIQLFEWNCPTCEQFAFSSVEELPDELKERLPNVKVPGIGEVRIADEEFLVSDNAATYIVYPDQYQPRSAVRALLD